MSKRAGRRGQTLAELAIILGLIAVVGIPATAFLGSRAATMISTVGVVAGGGTLTTASVAPSAAYAGDTLSVTGSGFGAGATVPITLNPGAVGLGSLVADGSGALSGTVVLPGGTTPGVYTLAVGAATTASVTVSVHWWAGSISWTAADWASPFYRLSATTRDMTPLHTYTYWFRTTNSDTYNSSMGFTDASGNWKNSQPHFVQDATLDTACWTSASGAGQTKTQTCSGTFTTNDAAHDGTATVYTNVQCETWRHPDQACTLDWAIDP